MRARLPALDGLRAVAALLVVATHAAYLTAFTTSGGLLGRLAARGDVGVAIFFALSGFLLHHGLAADARDGRTDTRAYAVRRAARVLPAYWVTLGVVVILTQPPLLTTVAQALTIQTYLPRTEISSFSQSWSIPTELSFYVALPFVVWALEQARRRQEWLPVAILVGSSAVAVAVLALVPVGVVGQTVLFERWLPARWPNFAVGMLLAEIVLRPRGRVASRVIAVARDAPGCLVAAGAAFVLSTTPIAGPLTLGLVTGPQLSVRLVLTTMVAGFLLAPLVLGRDDSYSAALGSGPARRVGQVSYGLFLWHLPVFAGIYAVTGATAFTGGLLPLLAIGLPVSLGLAWLSLVAVERPAMRWASRRVPHRRAPLPR